MIVLNVPYAERELAKSLGARWDSEIKKWVAPDESSIATISHWFQPITPNEAWNALPPRSTEPTEILQIANIVHLPKQMSGFCGMCDSNISDEWCLVDPARPRPLYELRHASEFCDSPLRPSELSIVLRWLEYRSTKPTGLLKILSHIWRWVTQRNDVRHEA